jgi:energy-coupling factor transporter ATP-binding protein EcfA2
MAGYMAHFGLKERPFSTSPDPRFAYATREHEIAATKIQYAVEERQGLFLLMGEIGTGKTTLSQFMMGSWRADPQIVAGHVTDPSPETPAPFLRLILGSLGQPSYHRVEDNKAALRDYLVGEYRRDKTVDGLTLVTYALKTIPPLLVEWGASGRSHGGVIFVDERTISPADFRGLARSLRVCWETRGGWDWNERIIYLKPA